MKVIKIQKSHSHIKRKTIYKSSTRGSNYIKTTSLWVVFSAFEIYLLTECAVVTIVRTEIDIKLKFLMVIRYNFCKLRGA